MKIIVLAGGIGTRLWPLSRSSHPKQIQPILGTSTLLQQTINRLLKGFKRSDIFIVCGKQHKDVTRAQLPGFPARNIIVEPERKNTAAAIGLAAYTLAKKNPYEIIVSVASDHYIDNENKFIHSLKLMGQVINKIPSSVCLMGVKPTYPETGYGYINFGKETKILPSTKLFSIKKFVEKPKLEAVQKMLHSGKYLWNPSYFAWRVDHVQTLFRNFIPRTDKLLFQTVRGDGSAFKKIKPEAIEYAVLEKIQDNFFVLPVSFPWADVGHWASVKEIQAKKSSDNVALGLHHLVDTSGSLIYNYTGRILSTIGVKDLIVVQTENGTLVCRKDRAQDVKTLVEKMHRDKKLKKFL